MRLFLSPAFLVFIIFSATAQTDTMYLYFNKGWKPCEKDTAFYIGKVYKLGNLWGRQDLWANSGQLQMTATYLDEATTKAEGITTYFRESGTISNTTKNVNGRALSAEYFYESGKKKGNILYTSQGTIQKGYDENGNEIPGYVVEREALFTGGLEGWKTYIESNLNAGIAKRNSRSAGLYPVSVQFVVDKEGNVSNVRAIEVPKDCAPCGKEAMRVIKNGPKWQPAMQDNKPVIYQALQKITFEVIEEN